MEIRIKINKNRAIDCKLSIIGKTFENEATTLKYELIDEELLTKDFYIEFEKPDGKKVSTPKLEIQEENEIGVVEYLIPNSLLDLKGTLKVEAVLRNSEGLVWKSYTQRFDILESINASEEISEQYPDIVGEVQRVIDLVEIDGDGNSYLSNDGTYKSLQDIVNGVSDYNELSNKPQINNVELIDNKSLDELGIQAIGDYPSETLTNNEIEELLNNFV